MAAGKVACQQTPLWQWDRHSAHQAKTPIQVSKLFVPTIRPDIEAAASDQAAARFMPFLRPPEAAVMMLRKSRKNAEPLGVR